jgi:Rab GDP dissociation inhibitor
MMVSSVHQVAKKGYYIAIICAKAETNNYEQELLPAFNLIGTVKEKFITVTNIYIM